MADFLFNNLEYTFIFSLLSSSSSSIKLSSLDVEIDAGSEALNKYYSIYCEFSSLIEEYQKLLDADLKAVNEAAEAIVEKDSHMF